MKLLIGIIFIATLTSCGGFRCGVFHEILPVDKKPKSQVAKVNAIPSAVDGLVDKNYPFPIPFDHEVDLHQKESMK